jgi:hypothetical protein
MRPLSLFVVCILSMSSLTLTTPGEGASTGHVRRHMPNIVGLTKAQVYAVMRHYQLYFRTRGPGSTNGTWVAAAGQAPAPGTVVAWHATVVVDTTVIPARGPRHVPRLVGLSRAQVYSVMREYQLYFATQGLGSFDGTWTRVIRQSPAPGTRIAWHGQVLLTVTRPGPTTTTTAPPVKTNPNDYRIGDATWYSYTPGHCATWFLPYGTHVNVTDLATGRTITCEVTDKESARGNRVVDLNETQFAELAPLAQGVIRVKVSW